MEKKEHTPQQAALLLLTYLHSQPDWSACIDGFSTYLSERHGIGWERTEFLLYHMEREGLIVFLGNDRYWIQMTVKGRKYLRWKGSKLADVNWMKVGISVAASIVATLIGWLLTGG